jgi:DNA-directed RNA polymerase subunit RPC12/RpoP
MKIINWFKKIYDKFLGYHNIDVVCNKCMNRTTIKLRGYPEVIKTPCPECNKPWLFKVRDTR